MKLPVLNNHKTKGIFDIKFNYLPEHYAWITHVILGILSIYYPILMQLFIGYQITQMIMKRKLWDDFIDIVEFFIGRLLINSLLNKN